MSESVNKNLGHATAYGYAKAKGYTGTEEEFAELMASYGTVAQAAAASASAAETAKNAAEAAQGAAEEAEAGAKEAERSVDDKALTVIQDIETAGAEQAAGIRQAGADQVDAVETAGSEQAAAVEQKGEQVRQSIPSDYTELSEDVGGLKERLNTLVNSENATYSAQGYHNLQYLLKADKTYKITVESETPTSAVSVMNPSGTQLVVAYVGTTEYTATDDVEYLRLYFNNASQISFTIEEKGLVYDQIADLNESVQNTEAEITDINSDIEKLYDLEGYTEATFSTAGYHNLQYPLVSGESYVFTLPSTPGNPTFAVSVMDNNSSQLFVVYNGQSVDYIAQADIPYLRFYWNRPVEATISITKKDSDMIASFVLPRKICTVVGKELNIFHNNIVRFFDTRKAQIVNFGYAIIKYFTVFSRYIGTAGQADFQAQAQIFNENTQKPVMTSQYTTFHVVSASAGTGTTKKVLLIGDSLTDADATSGELVNLFSDDVMSIELIGTLGTAPNLNEGRAGWRAYTYAHCAAGSDDVPGLGYTNPFYNPSTQKFDFSYYMAQNGFSSVDYVFICLGTNDIGASDHNTDADIISYYNEMITSIQEYNSNIKIGLWLPPTRALYANTNRRAIDTSLRMNQLLIDRYSSRESSNIYLVPVYLNVDPYHDYNGQMVPINDRNSSVTIEIVSDAVHPSVLGYQHIADVIYSYIKYFAE